MAKHQNGPHHHAHQVWRRQKLLITFHLQGLRMILSEFEVYGVKSEFIRVWGMEIDQNGGLPVELTVLVHGLVCASHHDT